MKSTNYVIFGCLLSALCALMVLVLMLLLMCVYGGGGDFSPSLKYLKINILKKPNDQIFRFMVKAKDPK